MNTIVHEEHPFLMAAIGVTVQVPGTFVQLDIVLDKENTLNLDLLGSELQEIIIEDTNLDQTCNL